MTQSKAADTRVIMLVGSDERLIYLLQRFFEQTSNDLLSWENMPSLNDIEKIHPSLIIFSTIELLEEAQSLLVQSAAHDIPVMVCAPLAGEARAKELGADACLVHPLTYDHFKAALAGIHLE